MFLLDSVVCPLATSVVWSNCLEVRGHLEENLPSSISEELNDFDILILFLWHSSSKALMSLGCCLRVGRADLLVTGRHSSNMLCDLTPPSTSQAKKVFDTVFGSRCKYSAGRDHLTYFPPFPDLSAILVESAQLHQVWVWGCISVSPGLVPRIWVQNLDSWSSCFPEPAQNRTQRV